MSVSRSPEQIEQDNLIPKTDDPIVIDRFFRPKRNSVNNIYPDDLVVLKSKDGGLIVKIKVVSVWLYDTNHKNFETSMPAWIIYNGPSAEDEYSSDRWDIVTIGQLSR